MGVEKSKNKQPLFPLIIMLAMMIGIPVMGIRESLKERKDSLEPENITQTNLSSEEDYVPLTQADSFSAESTVRPQSYSKDSKGLYILTGPVMDTARVLSESEYAQLNSFLMNLSSTSGAQIAVLTVNSLNGRSIEEYSLKHAEKWQLGQKGVDNGALLTVAMAEHEVRIETGYGTEGTLTDAKCSRIIRNVIVPKFQAGKYGEGIILAVENMAGIITSDESLVSSSVRSNSSSESLPLPVIIFIGLFCCLYIYAIVHAILHAKKGGSTTGGVHYTPSSFHSHSSFGGGGGFHGGGGGFGGGGASGHW